MATAMPVSPQPELPPAGACPAAPAGNGSRAGTGPEAGKAPAAAPGNGDFRAALDGATGAGAAPKVGPGGRVRQAVPLDTPPGDAPAAAAVPAGVPAMIVVSLPADPPPVIPETPADGGGPVPAPAPPLPGAGAAAAALQSAPPAGEPAQEDAAPGPARADTGVPVRAAGPAPTAAPAQPVAPDGAPPSTAAPEPPPAAPDGDPEKAPAAGDRPGDGGKKTLHAHGGPVTAESAATKRQPGPEERPAAAGPPAAVRLRAVP
ncbi:hypothetical protein G3N55_04845, partial [Dissulfurirhabdus thermomarina]|nr:hypothetical protein [Dissulfurirhabdus thermomarina]